MVFTVDQAIRDQVPGTIHLVDTQHEGINGKKEILLNPRPSADPEDPLNWPKWRKQLHVWMIYIYVFGLAICTAVQYSVLQDIESHTEITLAELNTGAGLMFLFLGWGCLIWQPIAMVFGRRGVYVLTSALAVGPMVWSAYSKTRGDWYGHRILIGILVAPVESLPELSIPDIFFAHERGFYIGIYALFVFGGNALAPFFAGFIANALGWQSALWFGTIVVAVCTVIIFFGLEETMYFRDTVEGLDDASVETPVLSSTEENSTDGKEKTPAERISTPQTSISEEPSYKPPRTYLQKLALFRNVPGRPSVKQMFIMMYRPLLMFFYFPTVDWSGFLYGINLSWYTVVNATMGLILSASPYNFSTSMIGVAFLSVFVGAVLGSLWAGMAGDWIALRLARRNGGIREPEHRLWVLLFSAIIGCVGFILWGVGAANSFHYMVLILGVGMVEFAVVVGGSTGISYNIDCLKEITGESMVLVIVIRNTLGFGFSYGISPWIDSQGLVKTFVAVGVLSLVCTWTFFIFIFFGKAIRKMSAKKYYQYVDTLIIKSSH